MKFNKRVMSAVLFACMQSTFSLQAIEQVIKQAGEKRARFYKHTLLKVAPEVAQALGLLKDLLQYRGISGAESFDALCRVLMNGDGTVERLLFEHGMQEAQELLEKHKMELDADAYAVIQEIVNDHVISSRAPTIDTEDIKNHAITHEKIKAGAVVKSKLAENSVSTHKIEDLNVTVAKFEPDAIFAYFDVKNATSASIPNTLVKRDAGGGFAGGSALNNVIDNGLVGGMVYGSLTVTGSARVATDLQVTGSIRMYAPYVSNIFVNTGSGSSKTVVIEPDGKFATIVTSGGGSSLENVTDNGSSPNPVGALVHGSLTVTGSTSLSGNFGINSNKFTVASSSGDTVVAGILQLNSNAQINDSSSNRMFYSDPFFKSTYLGSTAGGNTAIGSENTGIGYKALLSNQLLASNNTAVGYSSLALNTIGSGNAAVGHDTLQANTTGGGNAVLGVQAMNKNNDGNYNAVLGSRALYTNTSGSNNTAVGFLSMSLNSTGSSNTAIGQNSLLANTTGSSNIALGANAGSVLMSGSDNIYIQNVGTASESNIIRIGTGGTQTGCYIAGIIGNPNIGTAVQIDLSGQLGVVISSKKYKDDIEDMNTRTAGLMNLRPVTFTYKNQPKDHPNALQYGLIAEEVMHVYPELVIYKDGQPETVRYDLLSSMLLNEYQHQQKTLLDYKDKFDSGSKLVSDLLSRVQLLEDALGHKAS